MLGVLRAAVLIGSVVAESSEKKESYTTWSKYCGQFGDDKSCSENVPPGAVEAAVGQGEIEDCRCTWHEKNHGDIHGEYHDCFYLSGNAGGNPHCPVDPEGYVFTKHELAVPLPPSSEKSLTTWSQYCGQFDRESCSANVPPGVLQAAGGQGEIEDCRCAWHEEDAGDIHGEYHDCFYLSGHAGGNPHCPVDPEGYVFTKHEFVVEKKPKKNYTYTEWSQWCGQFDYSTCTKNVPPGVLEAAVGQGEIEDCRCAWHEEEHGHIHGEYHDCFYLSGNAGGNPHCPVDPEGYVFTKHEL